MITKELKIQIVDDQIVIHLDENLLVKGNVAGRSFTKVGVIEEYVFVVDVEEKNET